MASEVVDSVEIGGVNLALVPAWHRVFDIAEQLPEEGWTLIGGLMVQLHAHRFGAARLARATEDVDILGNSRMVPSATERIGRRLLELKFEIQTTRSPQGPPVGYRFTSADGLVIDVLAPDGLKGKPPRTTDETVTIQVKGGTQALARSELIEVKAGERTAAIPVPSLLAAILMKAQTARLRERESDRFDLALLLSCVNDGRSIREQMTPKEIRSLAKFEQSLERAEQGLDEIVPRALAVRARGPLGQMVG